MIFFIYKCKNWFSNAPAYWFIPIGFIGIFLFAAYALLTATLIAKSFQFFGVDSSIQLFISKFNSSEESFIFVIILMGTIAFAIIGLIVIKYKLPPDTMTEQMTKEVIQNLRSGRAFSRKYYYFKNKLLQMGKLIWSPSSIPIFLIVAIILFVFFWDHTSCALNFFGIFTDNENCKLENKNEVKIDIYRNRILIIAALFTFILTVWGRWLTHKQTDKMQEQVMLNRDANESTKYKDAVHMLENSNLIMRVGGCYALKSLGIGNRDIALQCIQLLMLFIKVPYLDKKKKSPTENLTDKEKLDIFPLNFPLREDIEAATNAFSMICEHYHRKGEPLNLEHVNLPSYFWKNDKRLERISLPHSRMINAELESAFLREANLQGANLRLANLKNAHLFNANLERANLVQVDFQGAHLIKANFAYSDLWDADFQGVDLCGVNFFKAKMKYANLSGAKMGTAKNLTKEQIRVTKWEEPPLLPKELLLDKDIEDWLKKPYDGMLKQMKEAIEMRESKVESIIMDTVFREKKKKAMTKTKKAKAKTKKARGKKS